MKIKRVNLREITYTDKLRQRERELERDRERENLRERR